MSNPLFKYPKQNAANAYFVHQLESGRKQPSMRTDIRLSGQPHIGTEDVVDGYSF